MVEGSVRPYSNLAQDYNQVRFGGPNGAFVTKVDRSLIRDFVRVANPQRIIDVPVGTGRVLEYLSGIDVTVLGLDSTEEMLEEARKVAIPERHELRQGNAADTGCEDGEFDLLISLRFFPLFTRVERRPFAREFCRIVRPGGYAIVSFTNGWYAGGLNWAKRALGRPTVNFEYPGEVRQLFSGWKTIAIRGNYLPRQWKLDGVPWVGATLKELTCRAPVNRVCWEKYYLLRKPG